MRWKQYLRFAALIPAITLVGAFIGCRSGAFDLFSKPEPLPEPHPLGFNEPPKPPAASPAEQPAEKKPTFLPGSKSINLTGTTIGLTPAGTHTPDLDVPVRTQPAAPNAPKP